MLFYDRLNGLCVKNGLNISRFAVDVLKVSNATPTGWKIGSCPRADVVVAAARYFGVTSDYLLGLSDSPTPIERLSADDAEVLSLLNHAKPEAREAAVSSMRAVISSMSKNTKYSLSDIENEAQSKRVL